jgi:DNA-binding transcriptional LysR family regulator
LDELRAITLFVRAAEAGSFQRAAADLGISPQAVSKAIRQLETHLTVRLFHRTTRKNSLTAEGRGFLELVQPGLEAMRGAIARTRGSTDAVAGPVRVTAAPSARKVLNRPLADFCARHPGVRIDLRLSNEFTDLVADEIDVGFRSGLQPAGQVIARRLFGVQQVLCAAPGYLAQHGPLRRLADLGAHRCTGFRHSQTGRLLPWELMVDGELRRLDVAPAFCTNDPEAEVDAVVAGQGIGLLDSINAAEDLRAGRLVALLPQHRSEHLGFYIFYPHRDHLPRRVRAFIDFMAGELQDSQQFLLAPGELAPRRRARGANPRGL